MKERLDRKLAAILYADVAGYSRLTGEDEDSTHRVLSDYLDLISATIEAHQGKVVHYAGDAVLAKFDAIVNALSAAIEIQDELETRNEDVPADRKVQFRIGINLGDVIEDRGDIYGDGVNVAARLESLADPGGICISDAVRSAVGKKLNIDYEDMGECEIKNITEPVRVFRAIFAPQATGRIIGKKRPARYHWWVAGLAAGMVALIGGGYMIWLSQGVPQEPADFCEQKNKFEQPDRPSVAVLPFDNLSPDTGQQYVGDIVSESIITTLAKVPDLFVIARNSTAVYKGRPVKIQDVAEELGVRYVIEGSVQQVDDRIRITAQLIDSETERHVWAERYDRTAGKSFEVMDEISFRILNALEVNLTEGEQARIRGQGTDNLEAYQLYMQAMKEQLRLNPEGNANAIELAMRATELDPDFWGGWTALGYASTSRYWFGAADKSESLRLGMEYARKAMEVGGESNPDAYLLLNFVETWRGNYEEAIEQARKALELSPNMADGWGQLGMSLNAAGRPDEAIPVIQKAMRLSPYYATYLLVQIAKSYRYTGRHEEAILANRELICRSPDSVVTHRDLALSYGALGQDEEARGSVAELLKIQPDYSLQDYIDEGDTGIDPVLHARNVEILRRAGLPN